MNSISLVVLVALVIPTAALAQRPITGGGGSSSDAGIRVVPPGPPKIIKETALTPLRGWKNSESKVITAMLLAHRIPGQDIEKGDPPVIVLDGKIRLRKDKKTFLFPLKDLSREDQNYIQELIFAIQEQEEKKSQAVKK